MYLAIDISCEYNPERKIMKKKHNQFGGGFEDTFWKIFPKVFIPLWCVMFFGIIALNIFALFNPRVVGEYTSEFLAPIIEKIKE